MSASSARADASWMCARDQLLADARLAGDEHRQVRGGDQRDLRAQPLDRIAGAEDRAAARLRGAALQLARHAPAMIRPVLERLDERGRPERRARQRAEHRQHRLVERVEPMRLERVCRQGADHLASVGQRAAQTGVDVIVRNSGPSEPRRSRRRTGRRAGCRWKAHGLAGSQDHVEPWVLPPVIAPRQRPPGQPEPRHGHQVRALQPEQARGIARDHPADAGDAAGRSGPLPPGRQSGPAQFPKGRRTPAVVNTITCCCSCNASELFEL